MPQTSPRVSALDDLGDRDAPVGSVPWAKWFVGQAKEQRKRLDEDVSRMQRLLLKLEKGKAWQALGILSFGVLCEVELGISEREAESIKKAKHGTLAQALAADSGVTASETGPDRDERLRAQARKAGKAGGRGRESQEHNVPMAKPHGNHAEALVRRLKRDAPDICERLARGEYPSARSAAIAAGIIKVPTVLSRLRALWARATPDEREAFLSEVSHA